MSFLEVVKTEKMEKLFYGVGQPGFRHIAIKEEFIFTNILTVFTVSQAQI